MRTAMLLLSVVYVFENSNRLILLRLVKAGLVIVLKREMCYAPLPVETRSPLRVAQPSFGWLRKHTPCPKSQSARCRTRATSCDFLRFRRPRLWRLADNPI